MAVTFHHLPAELFPEELRPYIQRFNKEVDDLFALEGRIKTAVAPVSSKRSDATVARNTAPLVDISKVIGASNLVSIATSGGITGPASSTVGDVVSWNSTHGAKVADGGKAVSDLVTGPASATSGDLASYNGATGKIISDSGITAANVVAASSTMTPDNSIVRVDGTARNIQSSGLSIDDTGRLHVSNTSGQGFGSSVSNVAGNIAFLFKDEIGTSRLATSYWLAMQNSAGTQKFQVNAPTGAATAATMAVGTASVKSSMSSTKWVLQGDSDGGGSDPGLSVDASASSEVALLAKSTKGFRFDCGGDGVFSSGQGFVIRLDTIVPAGGTSNDSGFVLSKAITANSGTFVLCLLDYIDSTWPSGARPFQIHDASGRGFLMEINPLGRINHSGPEIDSYTADAASIRFIKVNGLAGGRLGFVDVVSNPND